MNLAEYISNLNNIYNEYGPDLQVIFAIDDEGNDFKPINFEPTIGIYDDGEFEIEVEDNYTGYRCGESETRSFTVSWEEIFDVENIIENLKKESEERERKTAEKKLINEANAQKENIASERGEYERLIIKYEKS